MTPRARRLLLPALMTAVMLIVLLGLGTWQMQRFTIKQYGSASIYCIYRYYF